MNRDICAYYVLNENNEPQQVSELTHDLWFKDAHISRYCVAETHLIFAGRVWTTVTTLFTGVDELPHVPECRYLWISRAVGLYGEPRKYRTEEAARAGHDRFVNFVIDMLKREGIEVTKKHSKIPQRNEE